MTTYKKKMLLLVAAFIVCMLSILPWSKVAYASPEAEPTKSTIADKLILQLGPSWAGVEFELSTDMGKYPGTIVVGDNGVLTLELADSSTYKLSCLNSKVQAPEPQQTETVTVDGFIPKEQTIPVATPTLQEQAETQQDELQPSSDGNDPAEQGTPNNSSGATTNTQGIPTIQLVLFIGGVVLCVGGLIVMRILKKRCEYEDEDDDY